MRAALEIPLRVSEIISAIGGFAASPPKEGFITGITTDTRDMQRGDLFIAIEGDHFNGESFCRDAEDNGCICVSKGYSCLSGTIKAICRICIVVWNTCRLKVCKIYIREQATEILNPQLRTWVGLQYQFDIRCCNAELCDCRNGYRP